MFRSIPLRRCRAHPPRNSAGSSCKDQVRLFEAENSWLTTSLRSFEADELESVVAGVPEAAARRSVWPLTSLVGGVAVALAFSFFVLESVFSVDVPAGLYEVTSGNQRNIENRVSRGR